MSPDPVWSERADPVDGRAQTDRLGDLRRAGLELPGQLGPGRLVGGYGPDHVAAADERRHLLEQLAPPVQDPDPGRAVRLVSGPGVEIGIDRRQVHRHLGDRLGSVDQDHRAGVVRPLRDRGYRVDRAEHVRDVNDRDQLRLPLEQRLERIQIQCPVVEQRHVGQLGFAILAQQLPRDDVGVMFHLGQHHQIAPVDVLPPPGVGDHVDRGGRVGGEDRLLHRRSEPLCDPPARPLVQVGRLDRQRVHAAMDAGPRVRVVPRHRIDDGLWGLRGGARVEVRQRVPVDLPPQHRKLRGHVAERRGRRARAWPPLALGLATRSASGLAEKGSARVIPLARRFGGRASHPAAAAPTSSMIQP